MLVVSLFSIFMIALGLAMDAFTVSISNGAVLKKVRLKDALLIGAYFGVFQGLMPLIGWAVGKEFQQLIMRYDHWIAFILLSFIGAKMIWDSVHENPCACKETVQPTDALSSKTLLLLAIATSIDALVVGVSFAFLKVAILEAAIIIGLVTGILCVLGVYIGRTFGKLLCGKAEIVGGIVLILIGTKILLEHLGLL
uniref:manganese efflux pump MntP n=1 Tax=Rubeoparvulum massiliense TaxID=1631346 RepID=UPI0036F2CC91